MKLNLNLFNIYQPVDIISGLGRSFVKSQRSNTSHQFIDTSQEIVFSYPNVVLIISQASCNFWTLCPILATKTSNC